MLCAVKNAYVLYNLDSLIKKGFHNQRFFLNDKE